MNITSIATQGRAHQNEFVMEYSISYGTNGRDYVSYKDPDGNIKVSQVYQGSRYLARVVYVTKGEAAASVLTRI